MVAIGSKASPHTKTTHDVTCIALGKLDGIERGVEFRACRSSRSDRSRVGARCSNLRCTTPPLHSLVPTCIHTHNPRHILTIHHDNGAMRAASQNSHVGSRSNAKAYKHSPRQIHHQTPHLGHPLGLLQAGGFLGTTSESLGHYWDWAQRWGWTRSLGGGATAHRVHTPLFVTKINHVKENASPHPQAVLPRSTLSTPLIGMIAQNHKIAYRSGYMEFVI